MTNIDVVNIESNKGIIIPSRDISYYITVEKNIDIIKSYTTIWESPGLKKFINRAHTSYDLTTGIKRVFEVYTTHDIKSGKIILINSSEVHWRTPYNKPGIVDCVNEIYKKAIVDLYIHRIIRGFKL